MKQLLLLLTTTLVLGGCVSTPPKPDNPHFAPVRPQAMKAPQEVTGSIFNAATSNSLYGDGRAHRVGDIITVVLQESTSSTKSNKTTVDKSNSQSMTSPTVMGFQPRIFDKPLSFSSGESNTAFDGEGKSDMSNSLNGNITVTVHEVMPNGLMIVKGGKMADPQSG